MREVRFHFIAAEDEGAGSRGGEDTRLAAAILSDSLSRQGCRSAAQGGTVVVNAPVRREREPEEVFVLLDESQLQNTGLLERLDPKSAVLVCSARPARTLRHELGRSTSGVATVDAHGIAVDEGADPVVAALGAAARLVSFIDADVLCASVWNTFDRVFPYAARAAMRAYDLGYVQAQAALG